MLDLSTAIYRSEYEAGGQKRTVEAFSSYPHQVFLYYIKAEDSGKLDFDLYLTRRDTRPGKTVSYMDLAGRKENMVYLSGYNGTADSGIGYAMAASVKTNGGRIIAYGSRLVIEGASDAIIYVTGRTTYRTPSPLEWCENKIKEVIEIPYSHVRKLHTLDYRQYYNKMRLEFDGEETYEGMSIPERLQAIRDNAGDSGFAALYFNFARYLLISSSRPGSLPANLQGIWANEFEPSWGSKYTININLQMNYWMCEKAGLSDLHMPLMEHLKRMLPRGKSAARDIYGVDGACAHHVTDIWGDCMPMDYNIASTIWPLGYVWLCLHITEHFRYTGDIEFLTEYYPILAENAKFLCGYLYKKDGFYASGPSVSPENTYITESGEKASVCISPVMDIQIIREFFIQYLEVCEVLQRDVCRESVREHLQHLPACKIGKYGQIREWQEDYEEAEPGHRHISQLFGLYPGTQIDIFRTPELAAAAKKTLERRLAHGGGHTGWSCAWMIHFFARLHEPDGAYAMLQKLFSQSTLDNMLDNCPPFQIDGNFGGANAILEMLVQEYDHTVFLLPAVPAQLGSGRLNHLYLKCGGRLSMRWNGGIVKELELYAVRPVCVKINIGTEKYKIELSEGDLYEYKGI